jgi:hypothetical protein
MKVRLKAVITVLATVAMSLACSGGSSDGEVLGGGGSTAIAASFTPDEPSPGANSASMMPVGSQGALVTVGIGVTDTDDVFSAALDVTFDPSLVEFVDWAPGDLLEASGQQTQYLVAPQDSRVVVGASILGGVDGVDVTGSATLIQLTFSAIQAGSSSLDFDNMALLDSQSTPQEIPGVTWAGGTVVAN